MMVAQINVIFAMQKKKSAAYARLEKLCSAKNQIILWQNISTYTVAELLKQVMVERATSICCAFSLVVEKSICFARFSSTWR